MTQRAFRISPFRIVTAVGAISAFAVQAVVFDLPNASIRELMARPTEEIVAQLKDSSTKARLQAIKALRRKGDRQAVDPLMEVVKTPGQEKALLEAAVLAMIDLGETRITRPTVDALIDSSALHFVSDATSDDRYCLKELYLFDRPGVTAALEAAIAGTPETRQQRAAEMMRCLRPWIPDSAWKEPSIVARAPSPASNAPSTEVAAAIQPGSLGPRASKSGDPTTPSADGGAGDAPKELKGPPPTVPFASQKVTSTNEEAEAFVPAAQRAAEARNPALATLRRRLDTSAREPRELLEAARWCIDQHLYLQAEECLRAVLLCEPNHTVAAGLYKELALQGPGARSMTVRLLPTENGLVQEGREQAVVRDAGITVTPPTGRYLAAVRLNFSSQAGPVTIDGKMFKGFAGSIGAPFIGIYSSATRPIQGAKREADAPQGAPPRFDDSAQLWEVLEITNLDGEVVARFRNTRVPIPPTKAQLAAGKETPYRTQSDGSFFEDRAPAEYTCVFSVAKGSKLTHVQYRDEPRVALIQGTPIHPKRAFDRSSAPQERLAAMESLSVDNPEITVAELVRLSKSLTEVVADAATDAKLHDAALGKVRVVRRILGTIEPDFLPESDPASSRLMNLSFRADKAADSQSPTPRADVKATMRFESPGTYLVHLARLGTSPKYETESRVWVICHVEKPGLYNWQTVAGTSEKPYPVDNYVFEVWRKIPDNARQDVASIRRGSPLEPTFTGGPMRSRQPIERQVQLLERRIITDTGANLAGIRSVNNASIWPIDTEESAVRVPIPVQLIPWGAGAAADRGAPAVRPTSSTPAGAGGIRMVPHWVKCPYLGCKGGIIGYNSAANGGRGQVLQCPRCRGAGNIQEYRAAP